MGDYLTDNHHYELCDDTTSCPRFQNFPIPFRSIRHSQLSGSTNLCLKAIRNHLKSMILYPCWHTWFMRILSCLNSSPYRCSILLPINIYSCSMFKKHTLPLVWDNCSNDPLKRGNFSWNIFWTHNSFRNLSFSFINVKSDIFGNN